MAIKDMAGLRFGRLSVVSMAASLPDGTARWNCVCDCGNARIVAGTGLRAGRHKSCGCSSPRFTRDRVKTHGMSYTRTYRIWHGMITRCSDKAYGKSRRLYFDAGIRVCDRWHSFPNFLKDMGVAPEGKSIDRISGKGDYSKRNCRWATPKEQGNNTSRNSLIDHGGLCLNITQWAERLGIKQNTLTYRLKRGWTPERALQPRA